jgi:hypothetical protein
MGEGMECLLHKASLKIVDKIKGRHFKEEIPVRLQ